MGKFAIYNIPLRSLSEGEHTFDFTLDNKYFSDINDGESDIKRGNVVVKLIIKRIGTTFEFNFDLNGEVIVPCDRCLDDLNIEVFTQSRLFVKFGQEYTEESDEIVVIPESDGEINIAWFLYEFIALSVPMKKVHAPGKCNKMMSSKLDKHRVSSGEGDGDDSEVDDVIIEDDNVESSDTRWSALKDLELED